MIVAVVAFPTLAPDDRQWIEKFRAAHDPQAARIAAHFTLVFPTNSSPGELHADVAAVAASTPPISFGVCHSEVVRDAIAGDRFHVFLVPDEGHEQIARVHDRLYAGSFHRHLRSDLRFVPHMTIATTTDAGSADGLAATLGIPPRTVRGTIESLTLIEVGERTVRTIATFALDGRA